MLRLFASRRIGVRCEYTYLFVILEFDLLD